MRGRKLSNDELSSVDQVGPQENVGREALPSQESVPFGLFPSLSHGLGAQVWCAPLEASSTLRGDMLLVRENTHRLELYMRSEGSERGRGGGRGEGGKDDRDC